MLLRIFATEKYEYLAKDVLRKSDFNTGQIDHRTFPDGEMGLRFDSPVEGQDVVIIGSTVDNNELFEIYALACGAQKYGAASITLVIPFFGYQTMERAVLPGEIVTAKVAARMLSSIPLAPGGNRVLLFDLHKGEMVHYFEGNIRTKHVYCKSVTMEAIRNAGRGDFVLVAPDAGRVEWVKSIALEMRADYALGKKERDSKTGKTVCTGVLGDVKGKVVVVLDDMIRTGGSVIGVAKALKNARAMEIHLVATHGVFPGDAFEILYQSGLFSTISCTDSHHRAQQVQYQQQARRPDRPTILHLYSIAGLIRDELLD